MTALGGDDQSSGRQKFLADGLGLVEQTAGIPAEVNDEAFEVLLAQLVEGGFKFFAGLVTKLRDLKVADLILQQREFLFTVEIFDHGHLDDGAGEGVILDGTGGGPLQSKGDGGTGIAAQVFHDVGKFLALYRFTLNLDDAVASENAGAEAGGILHGGHDGHIAVLGGHNKTEAPELAFGVVLQFLERFGVEKFAVGIELADGAAKGGVNELLVGEVLAVHVFIADLLDGVVEQLHVRLDAVIVRDRLGGI